MPRINQQVPINLTRPFTLSDGSDWDVSQDLVSYYRPTYLTDGVLRDETGRGNDLYLKPGNIRPGLSIDNPEINLVASKAARSLFFKSDTTTGLVDYVESLQELPDHIMRQSDGSADIPFSVSTWFKLNNTSNASVIFEKYAAGKRELDLFVGSDNRVNFRLGEGNDETVFKGVRSNTNIISDNTWHHVVVTYDGVIANGAVTSFGMYVDGLPVTENLTTVGIYSGVTGSSGLTRLGAHINPSGKIEATSDVNGNIYSVGIWRRQLSSAEVLAIYSGSRAGGLGLDTRSGFISRSPRLHLRELDDLPGAYSTVQRTGDPTRTGALTSNFNDETTIVFSEVGNVVFPTMLPKGSSFASQAVDIIGQESDISASLPIRSFQQPTYLHYSPTEDIGPFDENRVMPASEFFLSGTDPDILPNFSSPIRSKDQIEIDITPSNDFTLTRNYAGRNPNPGTSNRSGFAYFNFSSNSWQDVGLIDPLNGNQLPHDIAINDKTSAYPVISGTENIVSQFSRRLSWLGNTLCSATGSISYLDLLEQFGSNNDADLYLEFARSSCNPVISFGAPNDSKYFATSSQVLKLSQISDPFLLEAVTVKVEVEAQCFFTASSTPYTGNAIYNLSPHDYVFFLYSQKKSKRGYSLSADEISGSTRSIIASASVTFYHAGGDPPFHSPSLAIPVTSSTPFFPTNVPVVTQFTGTLEFTFYPGSCGETWTIFDLPAYTGSTPSLTTRTFQGYWPGGSSATLKENSWSSDKSATSAIPILSQFGTSGSSARHNVDIKIDPRHHRFIGGESQGLNFADLSTFSFSSGSLSRNNSRVVSPYLLLPNDEIVLGIEQVPVTYFYISNVDKNFELFPSSSMTIKSAESKIILHGSKIRDQKEVLSSLNQDLSSNSIHEVIGAEPVLDQFMIEPRSSYYGSYLDEIVTGSMAVLNSDGTTFTIYDQDNSRRVVGRTTT